ncbi:Uncharacterised protein [Serratia marcescens]|uniref:Uncharacterized protein n=1 Tax=Serratia marcescens TaxID=615 RepID=A0A379Y3H5_SERMA|nr:Uncharacterised protein [Serratia marcescens]
MADHALHVVDHGVIIFDQHALALRQAVAEMVGAEHPRALRLQRARHVLIAAEVLAVAVYQQRQIARLVVSPVVHGDVARDGL